MEYVQQIIPKNKVKLIYNLWKLGNLILIKK